MSCQGGDCDHGTVACCFFCEHINIEERVCGTEIQPVQCETMIFENPKECLYYIDEMTDHHINALSPNDIEYYIKR